jgi:hypothetical protein
MRRDTMPFPSDHTDVVATLRIEKQGAHFSGGKIAGRGLLKDKKGGKHEDDIVAFRHPLSARFFGRISGRG